MYTNGMLRNTVNETGYQSGQSNVNSTMHLGKRNDAHGGYANVTVDELRFWEEELSQEEIRKLAGSSKSRQSVTLKCVRFN